MILNAKGVLEAPSIDLTPVIDIVFNLLIFFLIATTYHQAERELKIALPTASAAAPLSVAMREIVINVDARGQVFAGRTATTHEGLGAMIRDAVARNPDQKVTVRGDKSVAYEHIARVLDICKKSGIPEPYLETLPARQPEKP